MKCVKDCYFLEKKDKDWYCGLYDKILNYQDQRCKECENGETLYYNKKMNVFKRMVLRNAEERMGAAKTS